MPPKVKMQEKQIQQSNVIHVQPLERVSQMRNVPQGMNEAARIQTSSQSVPETRMFNLEKEVMRIAHEASQQAALMKEKTELLNKLNALLETKKKNERHLKKEDQNQVVEELEKAINKNKTELQKAAGTFYNLKREQLEKQIELTEETMRLSNIEITDEWRDEAEASILRGSIRTMGIFTEGALKDYQDADVFDGSKIEDKKAELAAVMRRIEFRKELDKGAKGIAAGVEQYKKDAALDGYQNISGEELSEMILEFVNQFFDQQKREEMFNPATIRNTIGKSLIMLDIWKADRKKRSHRKVTGEARKKLQRADQLMAYYEQHVNTVLGDYGMSLDRLAYSKENINELAKRTRNAERIDAWNKDYESYQRLFDGNQKNQNPDAENGELTAAERRLRELERQAGIVNTLDLKTEAPIYDLETSKKFTDLLKMGKTSSKEKTTPVAVFRLKEDVLSSTQDRKQVELKEVRLCYVCAKILMDLKVAHGEKKNLQFEEILPLVNRMVRSYENHGIRSYVKEQQGYREELMEKLSQIQRTSPIFQERRYASLLLGYLHSEQMGELVKERKAKEVRVYDQSYEGFGVRLERYDRPYIDRLKSVKDEPLFAHDPMLKDIHQGALGDCYFLAALASIVSKNPDTIKEMMKDNGDGTVTVRFYDLQKEETDFLGNSEVYKKTYYVTIDKTIPERTYLDTHTKKDSFSQGALWVKLMEKAYAAVRDKDSGYKNNLRIRGKDETVNYLGIKSGLFPQAMEHLTGEKSSSMESVERKNNVQAFRGHFTGEAPILEGRTLDSPSMLYFYKQHNQNSKDTKETDEKAKKYLAKKKFPDPENLKAQFEEELDGYKTIEKMLKKAFLSQVKLLEIQAMDTETYVDEIEKLGAYMENLISQLKGSNGQELSDKVLDSLQDYDWKGNKTIRSKEFASGGQIRRKAFEDIGYELLRDCWKVSEQNTDKLLTMIKGMLNAYTDALKRHNEGQIYTKTELGILERFSAGLDKQKNCSFGTKKFNAGDGVGVAGENIFKGICGSHAYVVTAIEEHTINNKKKKFLRVQNPHGGNIPIYLINENENGKEKVQRISSPTYTTKWMKFEKATHGTGLIELRDACSAMRYMSIT